jgi:hypothetical protein
LAMGIFAGNGGRRQRSTGWRGNSKSVEHGKATARIGWLELDNGGARQKVSGGDNLSTGHH